MIAKQSIFIVNGMGDLVRMHPSAPSNEASLQELIAAHPEIIADTDGALLLIQREQAIADSEAGGGRWSLDHLFVTRSAIPVLVEVKRAGDTRLRREVVGQMLDYAANGVAYWPTGTIADIFAETCERFGQDAREVLHRFLGDDGDESFWPQVDANFRAGRIKLVFVADEIPRELARIVEFLNEQMTADVRAVELRYFEGAGGLRTLVPRIIGETERAQVQKSGSGPRLEALGREEWIQTFIAPRGETILASFNTAFSILEELGAELDVASTQGSVFARIQTDQGKPAYPVSLTKEGRGTVNFGYLPYDVTEDRRREFHERFTEAVGPLSTANLKGYPSFRLETLADPTRSDAFKAVARDWLEAFVSEPG